MWIKKTVHKCRPPLFWSLRRQGSLWKCDTCGNIWKVIHYRNGDSVFEFVQKNIPPSSESIPKMPKSDK